MTYSFGKILPITEDELQGRFFKNFGQNDSPYDRRYRDGSNKYDNEPKYIYFYRIFFDGSRLRVGHYFWHRGDPSATPSQINRLPTITPDGHPVPQNGLSIQSALTAIAQIARNDDDENNPSPWRHPAGEDFDNPRGSAMLLWTIRSYIAFMIDDDAWEILNVNGKPAITFDNEDVGHGRKGNHSFYDAFSTVINMATATGSVSRNVVCMINHMKKDQNGDDLLAPSKPGHGQQNFKFNIFAKVKLNGWDQDNRRQVIVMIDPPGGNQGPPEAP